MMVADDHRALAGVRVLVTRPASRGEGLVAAIAEHGGEALACPTLRLEPSAPAEAAVARAASAEFVFFVSPAAVEHGLAFLPADGATRLTVGSVGTGTAAALGERGWPCQLMPAGASNSEGLLACPELGAERVRGRRAVIVRGKGGRALLGETLQARGADVIYLEVYARRRCHFDGALAASADIVTVTSNEGMEALLDGLNTDERDRVLSRPLASSGARITEHARRLGFRNHILTAAEPGDAGLIAAIIDLAPAASGASGHA